jgi:hypothetical protein
MKKIVFFALLFSGSMIFAADPRPKAPFKILFSNDTTQILSCISPYHKKGEGFRPEMLEASIDETAGKGIDVHILQPAMGWVPWWKSAQYPFEEHVKWMKERYGLVPRKGDFAEYMNNGGDIVGLFVERAHKDKMKAFVSIRLNDGHGLEDAFKKPGDYFPAHAWHTLSRFYVDHPQYRIGENKDKWEERVFNWAIPEVRQYRLNFIREIAQKYDIDGLELDFMRFYSFFRLDETTGEERVAIMTSFIKEVRAILDSTRRKGIRRWLCVRIPALVPMHDKMGIDLRKFYDSGVDMFNLSVSYFTEQDSDFAEIKRSLPKASVYLEMTQSVYNWKADIPIKANYDNFFFRRTTDEIFYTTADLAYKAGLEGVSFFNFQYYREHAAAELGPFNEPPFQIIANLSDPVKLSYGPKHYVLASAFVPSNFYRRDFPLRLKKGEKKTVTMKINLNGKDPGKDTRLRIQSDSSLASSTWRARFNGVELVQTPDVSEPFVSRYTPVYGNTVNYRGWIVPGSLPHDGENTIELEFVSGDSKPVIYLDLFFR